MIPQRIGGLTLLAIGAVLLVFGLNATHGFADSVNEGFTGRYTDKTMWYIVGGAALVVVGAGMALRGAAKTRGA